MKPEHISNLGNTPNTQPTSPSAASRELQPYQEEARLARAENRERKKRHAFDTRQKILIGACIREAARNNAKVHDALAKLLDRFLTRPADRQTCAPFLSERFDATGTNPQRPESRD